MLSVHTSRTFVSRERIIKSDINCVLLGGLPCRAPQKSNKRAGAFRNTICVNSCLMWAFGGQLETSDLKQDVFVPTVPADLWDRPQRSCKVEPQISQCSGTRPIRHPKGQHRIICKHRPGMTQVHSFNPRRHRTFPHPPGSRLHHNVVPKAV